MKTHLSFAGGGMFFLSHVGFLWAAHERGVEIMGAAGTSAGALASGLSASHLTPGQEVNDLILSFFPANKKLISLNLSKLPSRYGLFSLRKLEKQLEKYLPKTFADCKHPVAVFTSNIDGQCLAEWSTEATPNAPLAARVVDSCRIPGVFQSRNINGQEHTDGGVLYNYPIDYWKDAEDPTTIGIKFGGTNPHPLPPRKPWYHFVHNNIVHYLGHMSLMMDQSVVEAIEDAPRAFEIVMGLPQDLRDDGVGALSFDMTQEQALRLIEYSRERAHKKLDKVERSM